MTELPLGATRIAGHTVTTRMSPPHVKPVGRHREPDPLATLTDREHDVLAQIAEGRSNQAISSDLHLSA